MTIWWHNIHSTGTRKGLGPDYGNQLHQNWIRQRAQWPKTQVLHSRRSFWHPPLTKFTTPTQGDWGLANRLSTWVAPSGRCMARYGGLVTGTRCACDPRSLAQPETYDSRPCTLRKSRDTDRQSCSMQLSNLWSNPLDNSLNCGILRAVLRVFASWC